MSLLYEALLKNNQNKPVSETDADKSANASSISSASINSASTNNVEHSEFLTNSTNVHKAQTNQFSTNKFASATDHLQQGGKHIPSSVWIFIGSLLLVVGLLAGYIYGNALLANNKAASEIPELINSTENSNSVIIKEPVTEAAVADNEPTNENDDKSVEIALDSDGQVISKVSQLQDEVADKETRSEVVKAQSKTQVDTTEPDVTDPESVDLSDVPDNLKTSFAEAIKATERQQVPDESFEMNLSQSPDLLMLDDLTGYQIRSLPNLIYQMHIFSSDVSERWVRINGKTLYEGNELQPELTLLEIKQDLIVWRFNTIKVGQVALVDFVK